MQIIRLRQQGRGQRFAISERCGLIAVKKLESPFNGALYKSLQLPPILAPQNDSYQLENHFKLTTDERLDQTDWDPYSRQKGLN